MEQEPGEVQDRKEAVHRHSSQEVFSTFSMSTSEFRGG